MLLQVALLCEGLISKMALKWLHSLVHSGVVQNIPSPGELLVAVLELANVHGNRLIVDVAASDFCFVFVFFQKLQIHITLCHLVAAFAYLANI